MLVVCKNCNASYAVPVTKIGSEGRDVRCAKCFVTFFVEPNREAYNAALDLEKLADEIQNNNQNNYTAHSLQGEDKILKNNSFAGSKWLSFLLFTMLCGLSAIIFYNKLMSYPKIVKLYEKTGIYSTKGLSLNKITTQNIVDDENENLQLSGEIVNNNHFRSFIPNLRISVQDYGGNELLGYTMELKNEILLPQEKYEFSNVITNISPYAATITVEIGNGIEFLLR